MSMVPTVGVPDITGDIRAALEPVFGTVYDAAHPIPGDSLPNQWCSADLQVQQQESEVTRYARLTISAHLTYEDGATNIAGLATLIRHAEETVLKLPYQTNRIVTATAQSGPIIISEQGTTSMQIVILLTLPTNLEI
jgi:hypothetical protein